MWTCKNIQINKPHKGQELDMITLRNHLKWSYMKWLPVSLSVLDMIIVQSAAICGWHPGCWFQKSIVCFWPIRKEMNECTVMNYIPFLVESNWLFWSKVGRPLLFDSYWDSSAVGYCWGMGLFGCFVWYHCIWYAVDFIYVQCLYQNECNIISSNVLRTVQTSIHRTNSRDRCS